MDLVLYHGKIYLQKEKFAEAVWIHDDLVAAVGSDVQILAMAPFCQVVLRYFLKNLQSVELCVKSIRQHPLPAKPLLLLQSEPLQAPPAYALRSLRALR